MWWTFGGLIVGTVMMCLAVVAAVRQRRVSSWAIMCVPMVLLAAVRRSFALLPADAGPLLIAERLEVSVSFGHVFLAFGFLSYVAAFAASRRGRGEPALAQVGALMMAGGLVWIPWARGEASLWRLWEADPVTLEAARVVAAEALETHVDYARWMFVLGWGPAALWGYLRYRWRDVGDGVAAAMIVVLTLSTGAPARDRLRAIEAPWRAVCVDALAAGTPLPAGDAHAVGLPLWRIHAGQWERFVDGRWSPSEVTGGPAALVAPRPVSEDTVRAWASAWPGDEPPVWSGFAPAPDPLRLYDRHPAIEAARCRGWASPVRAGSDPLFERLRQDAL